MATDGGPISDGDMSQCHPSLSDALAANTEWRAQKAAHRAQLASEAHESSTVIAELRGAYASIILAGAKDLSHDEAKQALVALGMSGSDPRDHLPGAPDVLRAFAMGAPPRIGFEDFAAIARARMVDYDGPVCTLCGSVVSRNASWDKRHECEREAGVCSVFVDAVGARSGDERVAMVPLLNDAVIAVLCMSAGIDQRRGEAVPAPVASEAARVTEHACGAIVAVCDVGLVSIRDAQSCVEDAIISVRTES